MELAKLLIEQMKIMDETVKEVNSRLSLAKLDTTKRAYDDYRRILREITGSLYGLVGRMRVDRVLDPPEIKELEQLVDTGIIVGMEPRSESEF